MNMYGRVAASTIRLAAMLRGITSTAAAHHVSLGRWIFTDCDMKSVEIITENETYALVGQRTDGRKEFRKIILRQKGKNPAHLFQDEKDPDTNYRIRPDNWLEILDKDRVRCTGIPSFGKGGSPQHPE